MKRLGIPSVLLAIVALLVSAQFTLKVVLPTRPPVPTLFLAQHVFEFVAKTVTPVEVVLGGTEIIEEPPLIMERPTRWCATPRRPEPVLNEATRIAWGHENDPDPDGLAGDLNFARNYHFLWRIRIDKSEVFLVRDEGLCERAARLYDQVEYSSVPNHTRFNPVIVVAMGPLYLVDDRRPRRLGNWMVEFYDRNWAFAGNYGRAPD